MLSNNNIDASIRRQLDPMQSHGSAMRRSRDVVAKGCTTANLAINGRVDLLGKAALG
jgi:hypothetical protein